MSKMWIMGIAFILLLAAFPLLSLGTTEDQETLWWAGVALLIIGGLVPPITRYILPEEEDEEQEEAEDEREPEGETEDGRGQRTKPRDETEPVDIRAVPEGHEPMDEAERRARAHEQRAEAHRERAAAHEELARAEEERAKGGFERRDRDDDAEPTGDSQ